MAFFDASVCARWVARLKLPFALCSIVSGWLFDTAARAQREWCRCWASLVRPASQWAAILFAMAFARVERSRRSDG